MIFFRNPGAIDIRALTTFGLSSKDGEDTIGRFGTGLKYATAVVARSGGRMVIQSGGERYEIGTESDEFRGKAVTQLTMNGVALPYTTSLGRDWEPWMAFRELYANALDEGGDVERDDDDQTADESETLICVDLDAFEAIYFTMEEHFIGRDETPKWKSRDVEVYPGRSHFVFYRGIAIHKLQETAAFRYNLLGHIDLTEDRTAKYEWQIRHRLETALAGTDDEEVARAICDRRNAFEARLDFSEEDVTDTFVGASVSLGANSNETARAAVKKRIPDDPDTVSIGTLAGKGVPGGETLRDALARVRATGANLAKYTFILGDGLEFHGDYEVKGERIFLHRNTFADEERMTLACLCAFAELEGNRWLARRLLEVTKQAA